MNKIDTAVISDNVAMRSFLSRLIQEVSGIECSHFSSYTEYIEGDSLSERVFLDFGALHKSRLHPQSKIFNLKQRIPSPIIVVWGEEDIRLNQEQIVNGADDFLTPSMLTSPLFKDYLKVKFKDKWQVSNLVNFN